jgi:hypothetical protein
LFNQNKIKSNNNEIIIPLNIKYLFQNKKLYVSKNFKLFIKFYDIQNDNVKQEIEIKIKYKIYDSIPNIDIIALQINRHYFLYNKNIIKYKYHLNLWNLFAVVWFRSKNIENNINPNIEQIYIKCDNYKKYFNFDQLEKIKVFNVIGFIIPLSPLLNTFKKIKNFINNINFEYNMLSSSRYDKMYLSLKINNNIIDNYDVNVDIIGSNIYRYFNGYSNFLYN